MTEMNVHPLEDFQYCPQCGTSGFVIHDGKSKRCEGCGFVYYYNSAASTAALILSAVGLYCLFCFFYFRLF